MEDANKARVGERVQRLYIDSLVKILENVLSGECSARCMDDQEDVEAVLAAFRQALEGGQK